MSAFFMARSGPLGDAPLRRLLRMALLAGGGGGGAYYTLTGTLPLTLAHSLAAAIRSLTRYGAMTQSPAPTPSAPVYPSINGGTVQMVDDELPAGYKRLTGMRLTNARFVLPDFHLTGDDTLRFRANGNAGNWIGCFNYTNAPDNYSFYAATNSASKYARYNGQQGGSAIYVDTWYDVVMSPTGVDGVRNPSEFTPSSFTCEEPLNIGATSREGSTCSSVSFEGNIIVDNRLTLIPTERSSDGVIGWYDGTTFHAPLEGTVTSLGYDTSHLTVLSVVGTPEALSVGTQTASVHNLFAVGNYRDEVDVVAGTVTRRVGMKVLTGEEEWRQLSGVKGYFTEISDMKVCNPVEAGFSTHFIGTAAETSSMPDGSIKLTYTSTPSGAISIRYNAATSTDDFKAFLADQYAQGAPVIVWYPLATPTTESITPQALRTQDGTTLVSSSAGSVGATVEYKASEEPTAAEPTNAANELMMARPAEPEDGGAADGS